MKVVIKATNVVGDTKYVRTTNSIIGFGIATRVEAERFRDQELAELAISTFKSEPTTTFEIEPA